MKYPLGFVRAVNAGDAAYSSPVFENIPEGSLVSVIMRFDASVSTAYLTISNGSDPAYKIIQSDPPTTYQFVKSRDTMLKGDGSHGGTLRVWGWFEPP